VKRPSSAVLIRKQKSTVSEPLKTNKISIKSLKNDLASIFEGENELIKAVPKAH